MMTMISTFLSFLAGGLPKILQIFQDRQDKKHELALVAAQKERELALAERGFIAQARVEEIKLEQILIALKNLIRLKSFWALMMKQV